MRPMPSNSLIFELETYRGGIETWSGFTELARSEAPLFEVWECDFTAYKKALKSGGDATLKYYQHDRCVSMTPAEMTAVGDAMRVSEAGEPDGEHTHGGPCGLCRDTREAAK